MALTEGKNQKLQLFAVFRPKNRGRVFGGGFEFMVLHVLS